MYARFRYSDMKEAARDCGGRGLMRIQCRKERCWGVRRLCRSAGHTGVCGEKVLAGKDNVAASVMEGERRGDLLGA